MPQRDGGKIESWPSGPCGVTAISARGAGDPAGDKLRIAEESPEESPSGCRARSLAWSLPWPPRLRPAPTITSLAQGRVGVSVGGCVRAH